MKHQLNRMRVLDTERALREAEAELERPESTEGSPVYVKVRPQDIGQRLELFQPRRPGYGIRTVETRHVNELATRIQRKNDMDPVLIIKLGGAWVVVDGHHRLAAYRKLKRTGEIKCEWFEGSVREAMDESLKRNEKTHLKIDQGDKAETAWARTLMDWNGETWSSSKAQVVTLTGSSEGVVAQMRRVVKWHHRHVTGQEHTPMGEKLSSALGRDLRIHTWSKVNRTFLGLTPKEGSMNDEAAKLSRNLTMRMTTKLSDNPEVTARALWLYDRDLCPKLVEALQAHMKVEENGERDLEDQAAYERLGGEG